MVYLGNNSIDIRTIKIIRTTRIIIVIQIDHRIIIRVHRIVDRIKKHYSLWETDASAYEKNKKTIIQPVADSISVTGWVIFFE